MDNSPIFNTTLRGTKVKPFYSRKESNLFFMCIKEYGDYMKKKKKDNLYYCFRYKCKNCPREGKCNNTKKSEMVK